MARHILLLSKLVVVSTLFIALDAACSSSAPAESAFDAGSADAESEEDGSSGFGPGGPVDGGQAKPTTPVSVIITADNAYGFGYGDRNGMKNYFGGKENVTAEEIFDCPIGYGPEQYTVPADSANLGAFVYLVGWADRSTTQGILGQFFREGGEPVFTGQGKWEGCATGQDFELGSGGPSLAVVNEQIAKCNAGTGSPTATTAGWVDATGTAAGRVAFGEENKTARDVPTPGNEFPIVCGIAPAARWMWVDWDPAANAQPGKSAFLWPGDAGPNPTKDFVIFRLGAEQIPAGPVK